MPGCFSFQLIDGDGQFNEQAFSWFAKNTGLSDCGRNYAAVAIIGPQSSGKSTLLNHLFHTDFEEMDAYAGRQQTTKGIWIAHCPGINPFTIAMDLEGTDGSERGEDDTAFEKQSALFVLTAADIILINMWCTDIGREKAANRPLLKTVFQVMMRLFSPCKKTLLFVIRDKTKTPALKLEQILIEDVEKIWNSIAKPNTHRETSFSDFFSVEVIALSRYDDGDHELFTEEVGQLRQRFFNSISPGGLAGNRLGVVPASGLLTSFQLIWKTIKENRDLNLPAHKVMVATVRCEEIANEKLSTLFSDEDWLTLSKNAEADFVRRFGGMVDRILEKYLTEYDNEAIYFDEAVKYAKRHQLKAKVLELARSLYITIMKHLSCKTLRNFKTQLERSLNNGEGFAASVRASKQSCMLEFDKGAADAVAKEADWDVSEVKKKLCCSMEKHVSVTRIAKLYEARSKCEKEFIEAITGPVGFHLEAGGDRTWPSIRKLCDEEKNYYVSKFCEEVAGFELAESEVKETEQIFMDHTRNIVEKEARVKAKKVLTDMTNRFLTIFYGNKNSTPRVWTGGEDIPAIADAAYSAALKALSASAVIRLDEKPDEIGNELISYLMDREDSVSSQPLNPLASNSWKEVSRNDTLLTPAQCEYLWMQFKADTMHLVTKAKSDQEAYKRNRVSRITKTTLRWGGRALAASGVAWVLNLDFGSS